MKFNVVAGGCAEKEEGNLNRKCGCGNRDQRPPESIIRQPLRNIASERRTIGGLTQTRLPMKRDSTPRETPTVYIQLQWDGAENRVGKGVPSASILERCHLEVPALLPTGRGISGSTMSRSVRSHSTRSLRSLAQAGSSLRLKNGSPQDDTS